MNDQPALDRQTSLHSGRTRRDREGLNPARGGGIAGVHPSFLMGGSKNVRQHLLLGKKWQL